MNSHHTALLMVLLFIASALANSADTPSSASTVEAGWTEATSDRFDVLPPQPGAETRGYIWSTAQR
jgi:hypothetical protein